MAAKLPTVLRVSPDLQFLPINTHKHDRRRTLRLYRAQARQMPVARKIALGIADLGVPVSRPIPDRTKYVNFRYAVRKRMGAWHSPANPVSARKLGRFVGAWLRSNVQAKLDPRDRFDFDEWLNLTNYTGAMKASLRKRRSRYCQRRRLRPDQFALHVLSHMDYNKDGSASSRLKAFIKGESYPDVKAPRLINPRGDMATMAIGPVIKKIEAIMYEVRMRRGCGEWINGDLPWFIKHISPMDGHRARAIERLRAYLKPGGRFYATDHTAFEAHFRSDIMHRVEFQMYRWIARDNPEARARLAEYERILCGLNVSECGLFFSQLPGGRQSGDQVTSLGNGFTNLMLMLYAGRVCRCGMAGFVEGDDGIFVVNPTTPMLPGVALFRSWGFELKLVVVDDPSEASFCGNVYVPGEFNNLTDPIQFLGKAPWYNSSDCTQVTARVASELARAKAMSCLAQYAGCPVVHQWAIAVLSMTRGARPRYTLSGSLPYDALDLDDLTPRIRDWARVPITDAARLKVASVFGCPVSEQLIIERQLMAHGDVKTVLTPSAWVRYSREARV